MDEKGWRGSQNHKIERTAGADAHLCPFCGEHTVGGSMSRIFISYAREDRKVAERIYRDLKARALDPWLDTEDLLPGSYWKDSIKQAIEKSSYFIAIMSSRSVNKRGYVQKELRQALDVIEEFPRDRIFVIPVRLDECRPTHSTLNELHWVDVFPSYDSALGRILKALGNSEPKSGKERGLRSSWPKSGDNDGNTTTVSAKGKVAKRSASRGVKGKADRFKEELKKRGCSPRNAEIRHVQPWGFVDWRVIDRPAADSGDYQLVRFGSSDLARLSKRELSQAGLTAEERIELQKAVERLKPGFTP